MTSKTKIALILGSMLSLPFAAIAQTTTTNTPETPSASSLSGSTDAGFGSVRGDNELMIGGGGGTNKDFDNSFGGVNFAVGHYFTDALEGGVRQAIDYSNPDVGGQLWNGSTRVFVDEHLMTTGRWRPFVGANLGRVYGESVHDTWAAGLEAGAKYYVLPRTFLSATVEYAWSFDHSTDVNDRIDDGQWNWSLGVGFDF